MTTLASPPRLFDLPLAPERERDQAQTAKAVCSDGGRLTLEQRLDRVWEGLSAAGVAVCPVCDGKLEARTAAPGGMCRSCGSSLS